MSILFVDNISYRQQGNHLIKDICFNVNKGDFIGIVGPNGGGKTTLVKVLMGLARPTCGSFSYQSDLRVSYVPQKESFIRGFPISVLDTILTGSLPKNIKPHFRYNNEVKDRCFGLMKKLNIIDLKHKNISLLSGGELQKVLIARALISEPNLIMLDEPTANIDCYTENEIFKILRDLNSKMTILAISHNLAKLVEYATSFVVINCELLYFGKDKSVLKQYLTNNFRI
ncbi:ATP-binding cassette domain-containing protein [Clostridium sp. 'deep sea']|uniref:metal ABC transporter ATP-binding protein n=1 Tax=Clostridium sp. 'deep sea' TaxID=2779445 RepID=UPI0018968015|nr:ATP-binding cassette domain-containing protein [Clostridium sp. 'deep sea']QOR34210.1 ATP-binding cassette domain-containing protein [Clostridium sp. 'deep sea']